MNDRSFKFTSIGRLHVNSTGVCMKPTALASTVPRTMSLTKLAGTIYIKAHGPSWDQFDI
ncbi:hypothetical protein A3A36_00885 [Candidatus Kaiserbacteria bacterium RIFCSPLOWO2_01_FULL_52_12b]|uniref:Uncharacterized protein n=1 Tax=Candidatus Kaiserbacteria bacterium RIFCSPLOWO2_01_FULL_52_12b TaxID=1798509 RepID=A0A1F6EWL4_9BACT|nr:MAG: hypothetical protein A3A36_00885 [Candidatus Kaiserbacteria bacterium RIFCSPLOWO2_01_FULL_52_12b]